MKRCGQDCDKRYNKCGPPHLQEWSSYRVEAYQRPVGRVQRGTRIRYTFVRERASRILVDVTS